MGFRPKKGCSASLSETYVWKYKCEVCYAYWERNVFSETARRIGEWCRLSLNQYWVTCNSLPIFYPRKEIDFKSMSGSTGICPDPDTSTGVCVECHFQPTSKYWNRSLIQHGCVQIAWTAHTSLWESRSWRTKQSRKHIYPRVRNVFRFIGIIMKKQPIPMTEEN